MGKQGVKIAFFFYAFSLVWISYFVEQEQFLQMFGAYSLAFASFLYLFRNGEKLSVKQWKIAAFFLFMIPLFSQPALSPDVYRFLWDGELTTLGIHPYSAVPNELMQVNEQVRNSEYMNLLYANVTELSQVNYSIYPTINQFYFLISAYFSNDLLSSLIVLRVLMFGTLLVGANYLIKLLKLLSISIVSAVYLLLNPILIVEVMGNFHFEGVMLSWLFVGIYCMMKNKWLKSSLFWAIAINIKLTPLILLPFLFRYKGFKMSIKFYILTFLFSGVFLSIYLWPSMISNFMQSIELYFDNFEFNAGLFYISKWITSFFVEGNPTLIVGPALSIIAFISILFLAVYKPINTNKEWLNRMMWAYVIYLLLATTVHPWYIILPLGLAIFSANIGILVWSFLVFLSYGFYAFGGKQIGLSLIGIEYGVVIYCLLNPNAWLPRKIRKALRLVYS